MDEQADGRSGGLSDQAGWRFNRALAVLHGLAAAYQMFLLPVFLLPLDRAWAWTLMPLVLLNNPLWSLIHETIHGNFARTPEASRRAGRLLAMCYGAPWRVLRTGHLLHHRFNRTSLERQELYDPASETAAARAPGYYFNLLIGLYLTQVLSMLAFVLPLSVMHRLRDRYLSVDSFNAHAARAILKPAAIREIRMDSALIVVLFGAGAWAYGADAWMLGLVLLGRGFCISFLDYIYHYGSPVGDHLHAYNLRLPGPVQAALLNFNLHAVHHRHPTLPWWGLPAAFQADDDRHAGDYGRFALRQLAGPLALAGVDQLPTGRRKNEAPL